ncbi:putative leucine-rich repeat receptor-like serine/threonine-protein kinase At2g19230 [Quercus lobata]|uniref:putative leucine-rich repeat receptor-like serine/threonine-protein kinase At2g19230 n=1 Tax=Quercus lobata TaxID=97700 RepID=UPI001246CF2A|nr:putative leucine-rich repeat receptor-like serine/threonine-protein kinase At2g19230 [Quercus lobata]
MDGASNLKKVWLLFVLAIAILGNSRLAAGNNQYAGRKLDDEIPGFISIDCGGDEDYIDKDTGIPYKSDKELIDTGIVNTIPSDSSGNLARYLKNLRRFPQGKRNCYTLRPEQGKNNNYMIRARFFYGNYDGKNQTPAFDLQIGVNEWVTVNTDDGFYHVIHVPLTDYIDVCLVNTGQGVPYISALELRHLDNSIYHTAGGALTNIVRYDIGREGDLGVRYPNDVYDRYWSPLQFDDWIPITTNSTIYSHSDDNAYSIPDVVLRTAAKTQNASIPLNLYWTPPDSLSKCYVYFHFAEIEKLEAGQQRKLKINLNGERFLVESIKLDYLSPQTIVQNNPPISGKRLHFSIYAAEGTKLPPILNAVETAVLKELPNKPTAIDDVEAIMEIKKRYRVTRHWQGDPCVPSEFSWDGLSCSNKNPSRIISLNLSSSNLTGVITTSFSNLKALQSLDLSYNDLTGSVPEFLAQLQNLNTLNLSGNKLTGSVPEVLQKMSRDGNLVLSVGENPDLCVSDLCNRKKKKVLVILVIASSIAVVLVLLFIFSALAINRMKRHGGMVTKSIIKSQNQQYSYFEVVSITNNFKTIIGEGGFGKVYLGKLKDETQVAVKLLSTSSYQGYKEFRAEAQLLMRVHHRNLVSLVGYCDEGEKKALIYEYMANGNLHQHLSVTNTNVLTWNERLHIAVDAAHGLEYLHNGCKPPIIHRDLKPSNILLNEHMQAKIADFGLSRAFATESDSHVSTRPAGTLGYLDPEFQASGNLNKKSDVYSFGIILFELITGRPAILRGPVRNNHILDWVNPLIERGDVQNLVDPRLEGEFNTNSAWKAIEIAMSCIPSLAIQRPDMNHVLAELKECLALEMARGRTQRMETVGNKTTLRIPSKMIHLEYESDTAPHAR